MKAPVFTPAVAALTLATVLFSSKASYSNTTANSGSSSNRPSTAVAVNQGAGLSTASSWQQVRVRIPLIVVSSPGITVSIGDDGRRCYRNPSGYYYYEGRDGRYYLDERYIRYVDYDRRAYRDWDCRDRHYYKKYRKHDRGHGHGHGHGRGHGRGHDRDWDDD